MDYDRSNFTSDFLCPHCGRLLYVGNSIPTNDVCLNPVCPLWPSGVVSLIETAESALPLPYQELREHEQRLLTEICNWKPGSLARYAYRARKELIDMLFREQIMPSIEFFFAAGELLLLANKQPSRGVVDSLEKFRELLEDVRGWSANQRNLEDLRTRRYVLYQTDSGIRGFRIKFGQVVRENQRAQGIGGQEQVASIESMFPYIDIEVAATPKVDPDQVTDAADILLTLWPMSLQLRYLLRSHYRTAKQYDYRPDALDMTVLFGWCVGARGTDGTSIIPVDKELDEIQKIQAHFDIYATRPFSVEEFVRTYIDSTELVPIVARTADGFLLDYQTLLFFIIYLQGCPDPLSPASVSRGPLLDKMRAKAGEKFEDWLRDEIHNRGFRGPKEPVNQRYEYDIMAICEAKKVIIIADAKYRDIAPSSFTGTNLIEQELLGEHGLRYEASRQQDRLDHFRNNLPDFEQYICPQRPWEEYEIRSYLVTKHYPLAHRYKEIRIVRAIEFLAAEV